MSDRPWLLAEQALPAVRRADYQLAVLPWGATEAHNHHLPYGTDIIECDALAAESARRAWGRGTRVAVLPTVPFGVNTTQLDIPFTLNMNPSTQLALLGDLVQALEGQGVRKLVVFNGHGGNDFKWMIRELQPRTRVFLCTLNWWQVVDGRDFFTDLGDHAGELETSVMQEIAPELVRPLSEAGDGVAKAWRVAAFREGWAWAPRQWTKVTADTGIGDPRAATAERGARFAEAVCEKIAGFYEELAAADLEDLYRAT
ncbi:MAG: creatininase family protein [Gemmatimonadaceae bacterium]|nr:creatininase family protein [Gemmatimonadaceae bacterium]